MLVLSVGSNIYIPISEFEFTFARSGGPGGQNVNKVNSKAVLRWRVTESPSLPDDVKERFLERFGRRVTTDGDVLVTSQRYRDQDRNVDDCLEKLRAMIETVAEAPATRRPTKPSAAVKRRRAETKRKASAKKQQRRAPDLSEQH
ncbi:MAG TPA: alternative ribosome rescue aminoacyl-tRNA hydrolase ArfB [Candidatus Obscuribacterales bacterium]